MAEEAFGSSNQAQTSSGAGRGESQGKVVIPGRSAQGDVPCPLSQTGSSVHVGHFLPLLLMETMGCHSPPWTETKLSWKSLQPKGKVKICNFRLISSPWACP